MHGEPSAFGMEGLGVVPLEPTQPVAMESGSSVRGQQAALGGVGVGSWLGHGAGWQRRGTKMPRGHDMLYCGCIGVWRCSFAF